MNATRAIWRFATRWRPNVRKIARWPRTLQRASSVNAAAHRRAASAPVDSVLAAIPQPHLRRRQVARAARVAQAVHPPRAIRKNRPVGPAFGSALTQLGVGADAESTTNTSTGPRPASSFIPVSYTHLRAH